MKLTQRIAMEVASHEAVIRQAYKDSVSVWTWSVGLTNNSGHNVERYIDKIQTLEHCLEIYVWALEKYADDVRDAFAGHELTEAQFAGALSFHWNTGAIGRASWVRHWKAGNTAKAKKSIMYWKTPPEIIPRRKAERDLFFKGVWTNEGYMVEYTRLTSRHTPVWSSATRIDVSAILMKLMNPTAPPHPSPPPVDYEWVAPDVPVPPSGFWAWLMSLFTRKE